jgi:hypothetical protein
MPLLAQGIAKGTGESVRVNRHSDGVKFSGRCCSVHLLFSFQHAQSARVSASVQEKRDGEVKMGRINRYGCDMASTHRQTQVDAIRFAPERFHWRIMAKLGLRQPNANQGLTANRQIFIS